MRIILFLSLLWATPANAEPPPSPVQSFNQAKKYALQIYADRKLTFYCRCDFTDKKRIDPFSCGYRPRKPITSSGKPNLRTDRIEWEHVVPASLFAKKLNCGSRKTCSKNSAAFRMMEADLYNLVPAVGELNADRSNKPYGIIQGETREYGHCDFETTKSVTEPAPFIRGDVARIWLYMNKTYDLNMPTDQVEMFESWDKQDPISLWELIRQRRIEAIQGNRYIQLDQ